MLAHAIFTSMSLILRATAAPIGGRANMGMSLSQSCTDTLIQVATTPAAACLNLKGLISVGNSIGKSPVLPIALVDKWVSGLCAAPQCSPENLATINQALAAGCKTETGTFNLNMTELQTSYPSARNALCLKDTKAIPSQVCLTQVLQDLESAYGKIKIPDDVFGIMMQLWASPSKVICSDCMKAMMIKGGQTSQSNATIFAQCPTSFTDGIKSKDIFPF
ncbi:hypothetical protein C8J56DRAFT_981552 [Mycena floridula]|nr:hypothetical protein C8J56DRAFT_981552 [Mycena floridula]